MTELEKERREIEVATKLKTMSCDNGFITEDMTVGELKKRLEGLDDSTKIFFHRASKEIRRGLHHNYGRIVYMAKTPPEQDSHYEVLFGWIDDIKWENIKY